MSARQDVARHPASIFKGWAPHAMLRAHTKGLHESINLAALARRQMAGLEARPLCSDNQSLYRNWCWSMAQIPLYRAEIKQESAR